MWLGIVTLLAHLEHGPKTTKTSVNWQIGLRVVAKQTGLCSLGAGYVGDFTNVCVLDQWLPGFTDACAASPESSLFGSNYKDVYAFIVLILVLVFRPQGLLGERVGDRA